MDTWPRGARSGPRGRGEPRDRGGGTVGSRRAAEPPAPACPRYVPGEPAIADWGVMDDQRLGTAIRTVRQRRRWRQVDLAARCGISQPAISRLERGHAGPMSLDDVRTVAAALEIRVDLVPRWRAGDLDRLLNARHSALHESVTRWFGRRYPAWTLVPEASFAIYSDRGVIDILAWHPGRRAVLIVELKTDVADINELLGTLDRKRRVGSKVAAERGWDPVSVSTWLIVAPTRTNRRRLQAHAAMLHGALPDSGNAVRNWLSDPIGRVDAASVWSVSARSEPASAGPVRRVRAGPTTRR